MAGTMEHVRGAAVVSDARGLHVPTYGDRPFIAGAAAAVALQRHDADDRVPQPIPTPSPSCSRPRCAPADDDPGAVAVIWADWQSCSDTFEELLDPVRAQYLETFVVVRCAYEGQTYSRCVYIWVDKDFAMVRGYHQGYPKKLGSLHVTRPVTVGVAGPRLEPGGRFGATCSAYGRRLIDATFTITGTAPTAGFVNGHPMLHHRVFPAIESDGTDSLHELVTMRGYDVEVGPCYAGDATIEFHDSPVEELTRLAPDGDDRRLLAGGRHELAGRHDARAPQPGDERAGAGRRPGPADADIADPDTYVAGVPHATFLRLRRDDPVSWWDEDHAGGRGFWAVTRHADLLTVSRDVETLLQRPGDPPRGDGRRGDRGPAHDDGARPAGAHGVPAAGVEAVQPARGVTPTSRRSGCWPARSSTRRCAGPPTFDFVDRHRQAAADADAGHAARRARRRRAVARRAGRRAARQHRSGVHDAPGRARRHRGVPADAVPQPGRHRAVPLRPGAGPAAPRAPDRRRDQRPAGARRSTARSSASTSSTTSSRCSWPPATTRRATR